MPSHDARSSEDEPEGIRMVLADPMDSPEDKQLDRYGRELIFVKGPFIRPNRATRRAAGIRSPIKLLNSYKDIMDEALSDDDTRD